MTLKEIVKRAGYRNLKEFSEINGLDYDTVKSWSNRRREPLFRHTMKLIKILGVDDLTEWEIYDGI